MFALAGNRKLKVLLIFLLLVNVLVIFLFIYHQLNKPVRSDVVPWMQKMEVKQELKQFSTNKKNWPEYLIDSIINMNNGLNNVRKESINQWNNTNSKASELQDLPSISSSIGGFNASRQPEKTEGTVKKILLWNSFFESKTMMLRYLGTKHFRKYCEVKDCTVVTHDDNKYPLKEIDALVYHAWSNKLSLPSIRSPHTRYVFFLLESPDTLHQKTRMRSSTFNDKFNLTMTHRRDADMTLSYGNYIKRNYPITLRHLDSKIKNKNKMAVWMSSNCITTSQRSRLVRALNKHFPIDGYGKCGLKSCSKNSWKKCVDTFERQYKFYLSFENSLCMDYVTEKFYLYASHYIVPVVYGGADYTNHAPPKSYINVRDFHNVTHLANYLLYLNNNDTAYKEYFLWKENYKLVNMPEFNNVWCDLCAKLHQPETKTYTDFGAWFDKCENPNIFLSKFLV